MKINQKIIKKHALLANLDAIKTAAKGKKICLMVKADAYGHGLQKIGKMAWGKTDYFGVAHLEEGLAIRRFDKHTPVLLVGHCVNFRTAVLAGIEITLYDLQGLSELMLLEDNLLRKAKVHIKINSGMNRLGFSCLKDVKKTIRTCLKKEVKIAGIFTHFATADNDAEFFSKQNDLFRTIKKEISQWFAEDNMPLFHGGGTACLRYDLSNFDMVRVGFGAYGYGFSGAVPVMEIRSRIVHLFDVKKGSRIGYANAFICPKAMRIASIPVGYGDGIPRFLSNNHAVLIRRKLCPILGNVCMDMMMVDVTDADAVLLDQAIVFWNAEVWAEKGKTNAYEILTGFQSLRE